MWPAARGDAIIAQVAEEQHPTYQCRLSELSSATGSETYIALSGREVDDRFERVVQSDLISGCGPQDETGLGGGDRALAGQRITWLGGREVG